MNHEIREPLIKEFILQKLIRGCLYDRRVLLTFYEGRGRCLVIVSKNGKTVKEKNIIPLFLKYPLENAIITLKNKELMGVSITRPNSPPAIFTSFNELLINLLISEIALWITKSIELKNCFLRWGDCLQTQMIKCVHSLQNKKYLQDRISDQNKNYQILMDNTSKQCAKIALMHIIYVFNSYKNNFLALQKDFFALWYDKWEKCNLKKLIKIKHNLIKSQINFFTNTSPSENLALKYKNNIDDINHKLESIYNNINLISLNLSKHLAVHSVTEDVKGEIVTNLQQLADLRHHIQSINNNEEEFILVGDQSSGKSSLLCMLLGVNIAYTDQIFATRCPVRYMLEPCDPKMGWKYEIEDPLTKMFEYVTQEELQKKLISHFKGTIGRKISFEPLNIKILSPICTSSMTLVDLPGLVGISESKEKTEQHNSSYALVKKYLQKT